MTMLPDNLFPDDLASTVADLSGARLTAWMIDIEQNRRRLANLDHIEYWLDGVERSRWSGFRLAKRRDEWLAGRVCAKMAVARHPAWSEDAPAKAMSDYHIGNHDDGRPFATCWRTGQSHTACHISISHSSGLAAALAASCHCGIDVQEANETLVRIRERFCRESEAGLLRDRIGRADELYRLTLLWAAKEAVRKTASSRFIPGFLSLQLQDVDAMRDCWLFLFQCEGERFAAAAATFGRYGLALSIGDNLHQTTPAEDKSMSDQQIAGTSGPDDRSSSPVCHHA